MLQHLGATGDALAHLKEVRVKVYTSQQLKGKLEGSALLMHQWLQAHGDKKLIQPYVLKWLKHYDITLEAQFIYTAWTDAGGDEAVIRMHQANWLKEHDPASAADN